jgi:hypothetical protein
MATKPESTFKRSPRRLSQQIKDAETTQNLKTFIADFENRLRSLELGVRPPMSATGPTWPRGSLRIRQGESWTLILDIAPQVTVATQPDAVVKPPDRGDVTPGESSISSYMPWLWNTF